MGIGTGAGTRFAYVVEATAGTTPTTPVFQIMRVTGGGLSEEASFGASDEVQADRNSRGEFVSLLSAAGQYPFEMSYGSFDTILESAVFGAWNTHVLKNGTTRKYFTFEETVELGATDSFSRFTRGIVSRFGMEIEAESVIRGSFDVMAEKETLDTAIISGATYTAANTKAVMTSGVSIGNFSIHGLSPLPTLRSIRFDINNNMRNRPQLGSLYSADPGDGKCDVTGSFDAYFESNALWEAVKAHGTGAIAFTIGSVTTEKYTISFPNTQLLNGSRRIGGNDDDIIVSVPFRASYDGTATASISITRNVA